MKKLNIRKSKPRKLALNRQTLKALTLHNNVHGGVHAHTNDECFPTALQSRCNC